MKKYEIMYIIRPTVESESIKTIVNHFNEIFVSYTSEVLEIKELGLKELAYEIDHHKKGYYVWLLVNATESLRLGMSVVPTIHLD